jgi:hypothetical protein
MIRRLFRLAKKHRDALLDRVRAKEMEDDLAREIHLKEVELSQLHEVVDIAKREAKESRVDLRRALRARRRIIAALDGFACGFDSSVVRMADDLNGGGDR